VAGINPLLCGKGNGSFLFIYPEKEKEKRGNKAYQAKKTIFWRGL